MSDTAKRQAITELGNYKLINRIGEGCMGSVYKAKRKDSEQMVAVKVLYPHLVRRNSIYLERFKRESQAAAKLKHPNMVQAIDYSTDKGYHYLAMEFVDGQSVLDSIKKNGKIPEKEAIEVLIQVTCALKEIEKLKLIHRDIKPSNILVAKDGTAKLTDLGLVKVMDSMVKLTANNISIGSPYYMSPEQIRGDKRIDIRSDMYSMGTTLYHMLTGHVPYDGVSTAEVIYKQLNAEIPDPRKEGMEISEGPCILLEKMMAKKPDDRCSSPDELLKDLYLIRDRKKPSIMPSASARAMKSGRPEKIARPKAPYGKPKKSILTTLAACSIVVAVVSGAIFILSSQHTLPHKNPKVNQGDKTPIIKDNPRDDPEKTAKELYDLGTRLATSKEWAKAISAFETLGRQHSMTNFYKEKTSELQGNMVLCKRMLEAEEQAKNAFRQAHELFTNGECQAAKSLYLALLQNSSLTETNFVLVNRKLIEQYLHECDKLINQAPKESKISLFNGKDLKGWSQSRANLGIQGDKLVITPRESKEWFLSYYGEYPPKTGEFKVRLKGSSNSDEICIVLPVKAGGGFLLKIKIAKEEFDILLSKGQDENIGIVSGGNIAEKNKQMIPFACKLGIAGNSKMVLDKVEVIVTQ